MRTIEASQPWQWPTLARAGAVPLGRLPACLLVLLFLAPALAAGSEQPHILFIAVDDLRPELSAYGVARAQTPHIDRLAASGLKFDRAYANVPVCGASRASLMTGLRPTRERFLDYDSRADHDAPGAVGLHGWLKRHGYVTLGNGKIFHHPQEMNGGWDFVYRPREFKQYNHRAVTKHQGIYEGAGVGRWAWQAQDVPDEALQGGKLAQVVEAQLADAARSDRPWFITMGLTKPHLPFISPTRYWDLYDHDAVPLAENPFPPVDAPPRAIHNWGELRHGYDLMPAEGPVSDEVARHLVHGYLAAVSYSDAMIGRALEALERHGIADRTIIILWGDHGYQLGEHSLWAKHSTFRTSLQVPLIVRAPGITPRGASTGALVELVDLFPTICELAGIPKPPQLEGDSFLPVLRDPAAELKEAAFARYGAMEAVIFKEGIYTRFADTGEAMYYDHGTDPAENRNVLEDPAHAATVARARRFLEQGD